MGQDRKQVCVQQSGRPTHTDRFKDRSSLVSTPETCPTPQKVAHLLQGQDNEGSPTAGVDDDGNEFGVDSTEGAVPRDPGHADVIVALVVPHRLAENVTELALSHNSPHHICEGTRLTGRVSDQTTCLFHLLAR